MARRCTESTNSVPEYFTPQAHSQRPHVTTANQLFVFVCLETLTDGDNPVYTTMWFHAQFSSTQNTSTPSSAAISVHFDTNRTAVFFVCGKGPRSRSYGRTAALRLLVQPCDVDDDNDDYFLSFS
jgi:hypothetical protein